MMIKKLIPVVMIFVASVTAIPRIALLRYQGPQIKTDSIEYLTLANNLYKYGNYSVNNRIHSIKAGCDSLITSDMLISSLSKNGPPLEVLEDRDGVMKTMWRAPGYPFFIAAVFAFSGYSTAAIVWAQILLSVFTAMMLLVLSRRVMNKFLCKPGNIACWVTGIIVVLVFSLHPGMILSSITILRESFEVFLVVALLLSSSSDKRYSGIVSGLSLGVLLITLPSLKLFLFMLISILVFRLMQKKRTADLSIKKLILTCSVSLLLLFGWSIRNLIVFGVFTDSSFKPGMLLYTKSLGWEAKGSAQNDIDPKDLHDKYKLSTMVNEFNYQAIQTFSGQRNGNLRSILLQSYSFNDKELIRRDSYFRKAGLSILIGNVKKMIVSFPSTLFDLFRLDYYFSFGQDGIQTRDFPHLKVMLLHPDIMIIMSNLRIILLWLVTISGFIILFIWSPYIESKLLLVSYLVPSLAYFQIESRVTLHYLPYLCIAAVTLYGRMSNRCVNLSSQNA